jgi:chromosome segregation ATPase
VKNTNETRSSNSILTLMSKIPDTGSLRRVLGEIEEEVKTTKSDSKSLNKEYLKFVKEKKKHFEDLDLKQFELSNTQVKHHSIQEDIKLIKSEIERVHREDTELDVTLSNAEIELDLVDSERMHLEQTCLSFKDKLQVRKAQVATIKNKIEVTNSLTKDFQNNQASFEIEVASIIKINTELDIVEQSRNKLLKSIEKEVVNAKLNLEKSLKDKES